MSLAFVRPSFVLDPSAFRTLPDGQTLLGTPTMHIGLTAKLGAFERCDMDEMAARVLLALASHGQWASVRVLILLRHLRQEAEAITNGSAENRHLKHTTLLKDDPMSSLSWLTVGLHQLIDEGFLGADSGPFVIWPTAALIERLPSRS